MSQNNRKRTVCVECRACLTRSTSGKCRACLLKPAEAPREVLDASQQGAWTEEGKRRRAAELQRRRDQHKPLSLDAQAEIVAAVECVPTDTYTVSEARLPVQTTSAPSEPEIVPPAPISKAEDWQARDVWAERVVVWSIVAMMIGLGLACLLGRGAP